jgi:hypothetical protein
MQKKVNNCIIAQIVMLHHNFSVKNIDFVWPIV